MEVDMSEKTLYTSGDLARAAGVSIRTVRYYEERGLIACASRDEGGRRLFDEEALERMHTICLMKSMGLRLKEIKDVLETEASPEVLRCLFAEQHRQVESDIETRREMLLAIERELDKLGGPADSSAVDTGESERKGRAMSAILAEKGTKLRATQQRMLIEGLVVNACELFAIGYGIKCKNWWPLAMWVPLTVVITAEVVRNYYRDARYLCPHCHETFQPVMREFFFASHTPKTRKLTCPCCGEKGWCVEVSVTDEK